MIEVNIKLSSEPEACYGETLREARTMLNSMEMQHGISEFIESLRRFKHRDLTPEAEKVLDEVRSLVQQHLAEWSR